jgi:hypothetical protein
VEENVVGVSDDHRTTFGVQNAKSAHRFALDPVVTGWTFDVSLDSRPKSFECDADEIRNFVVVALENEAAIARA